MSAEAVGWVYRHSPHRGGTFQVHHAMADSVNDAHGNEFWMKLDKLAAKARVSRATAERAIDALLEAGHVELLSDRGGGRGRPAHYRFVFTSNEDVVFDTRASCASNDGDPPRVKPHRAPVDNPTKPSQGDGVSDTETRAWCAETPSPRATHRTQENPRTTPTSSSSEEPPTPTGPVDDDDNHDQEPTEPDPRLVDLEHDTAQARLIIQQADGHPVHHPPAWLAETAGRLAADPDFWARARQLLDEFPKLTRCDLAQALADPTGVDVVAGWRRRRETDCTDCGHNGDPAGMIRNTDGLLTWCPTCRPSTTTAEPRPEPARAGAAS